MRILKLLLPLLNRLPLPLIERLGKAAAAMLLRSYARIEMTGGDILKDRIGKPTIYISNHLSNVDGMVLNRVLRDNSAAFMAGVKLGKTSLTSFFLKSIAHIPINPNSADKKAIKQALNRLKEGGSIVIFPEGTRSRTGSLIRVKNGFLLIVRMAGVPIVPIALEGTEKLLPINDSDMGAEKLHKAEVRVKIGEPFTLPDKSGYSGEGDWESWCASYAMYKIAEMLKPEYQGEYRLKQ